MTTPLSDRHLAAYIAEHGIEAELITFDTTTPTVAAAAAVVGCTEEQIVKSVLFLVDRERPLLAISNGTSRIDYRAVAAFAGVGRKRVRLADAAQVLAITGYEAGSVPPFGHRQALPGVLDAAILEQEVVYAGGGALDTLIRIAVPELRRVLAAPVSSLSVAGG